MALLDILGPANAPNATTARPSDDRSFGASDSWFKDCTSAVSNDGTKIKAAFLNAVAGAFRALIRSNGNTLLGDPIVAENNADDAMALKAILHQIQRGQTHYGIDGGSSAALVASLSPAPAEYKAGMVVRIKVASAPAGPTTLNLSALGAKSITYGQSTVIPIDLWKIGDVVEFLFDGTVFQVMGVRPPVLASNRTFYVDGVNGSDSYDGLAASLSSGHGPWATIKKAAVELAKINLNGYTVNVNVANAVYSGGVVLPAPAGTGKIVWTGNRSTPASCVIDASDGLDAIRVNGGVHDIFGFQVQVGGSAPASSYGSGIVVANGSSTVKIGDISWGNTIGAHLISSRAAAVSLGGKQRLVGSPSGARSSGSFAYALYGGIIDVDSADLPQLYIDAPVSFPGAFVYSQFGGNTFLVFGSQNGVGPVTGSRFKAELNGLISTGGRGTNYYPGDSAGNTNTGGTYA